MCLSLYKEWDIYKTNIKVCDIIKDVCGPKIAKNQVKKISGFFL